MKWNRGNFVKFLEVGGIVLGSLSRNKYNCELFFKIGKWSDSAVKSRRINTCSFCCKLILSSFFRSKFFEIFRIITVFRKPGVFSEFVSHSEFHFLWNNPSFAIYSQLNVPVFNPFSTNVSLVDKPVKNGLRSNNMKLLLNRHLLVQNQ